MDTKKGEDEGEGQMRKVDLTDKLLHIKQISNKDLPCSIEIMPKSAITYSGI